MKNYVFIIMASTMFNTAAEAARPSKSSVAKQFSEKNANGIQEIDERINSAFEQAQKTKNADLNNAKTKLKSVAGTSEIKDGIQSGEITKDGVKSKVSTEVKDDLQNKFDEDIQEHAQENFSN